MMLRTGLVLVLSLSAIACGEDVAVLFEDPAAGGAGGGAGASGGGGFGGDGAAGHGAGDPVSGPRLFVAADEGVLIWNGDLGTPRPPDDAITSVTQVQAIAAWDATFVTTADPAAALVVFGNPFEIDGAATPKATIPRAALPGAANVPERLTLGFFAGEVTAVAVSSFLDGAYLFNQAGALDDASLPSAHFTHAFQQLPSVALELGSGRLVAGQISGAGVLVWDDALDASGSPAHDHELSPDAVWDLVMMDGHLYGAVAGGGLGGHGGGGVAIWSAGALGGASAPEVLLGETEGVIGFIEDIEVDNDMLVVLLQGNGPGTGGSVLMWQSPSSITSPRPPDATVTLAEPGHRVEYISSGALFVLGDTGVAVYAGTELAATHTGTGFHDLFVTQDVLK